MALLLACCIAALAWGLTCICSIGDFLSKRGHEPNLVLVFGCFLAQAVFFSLCFCQSCVVKVVDACEKWAVGEQSVGWPKRICAVQGDSQEGKSVQEHMQEEQGHVFYAFTVFKRLCFIPSAGLKLNFALSPESCFTLTFATKFNRKCKQCYFKAQTHCSSKIIKSLVAANLAIVLRTGSHMVLQDR